MSTEKMKPVAWTLTRTLEKAETTTTGYLWFSDPVNCSWTPLYTASQLSAAVKNALNARKSVHTETSIIYARIAGAVRNGATDKQLADLIRKEISEFALRQLGDEQ